MKEFMKAHLAEYVGSFAVLLFVIIIIEKLNMNVSPYALETGIIAGTVGLSVKLHNEDHSKSFRDWLFPISLALLCNLVLCIWLFVR